MRIAQVAPLHESVPPTRYGGTERVVSYLTEELVRQGHEVTLFASGDSTTSAELVPCCGRSLRTDPSCIDPLPRHVLMLEQVLQRQSDFDLIHFHIDPIHFPSMRRSAVPHVTTLHGRLDTPDLPPLFEEFTDIPVVAISNAQRCALPEANWAGTVHHGIPDDFSRFCPTPGDYFAFVGRVSHEKRLDRAIAIATALDVPLRIAAKIGRDDREYFETELVPLLRHPLIEFVGEIGDDEKGEFLAGARALLFPIDWPEPFGLVMIEAMACGTPVVGWHRGAVPEIVEDGVTGFVVGDMSSAIQAARAAGTLDRGRIREEFERRFHARRMASAYLNLYHALLGQYGTGPRGTSWVHDEKRNGTLRL